MQIRVRVTLFFFLVLVYKDHPRYDLKLNSRYMSSTLSPCYILCSTISLSILSSYIIHSSKMMLLALQNRPTYRGDPHALTAPCPMLS